MQNVKLQEPPDNFSPGTIETQFDKGQRRMNRKSVAIVLA
jgi:hypothetical protein